MSEAVESAIAEVEGPAALPRKNGELVFEAPWESRAFAIAVALSGDVYEWEEFRSELIARIAAWESEHGGEDEAWSYYERWLGGLESMLVERRVLSSGELTERIAAIRDREQHEHDHDHDRHSDRLHH